MDERDVDQRPASEPPPPATIGQAPRGTAAGLDTAERLLAVGAGLFLLVYLIFHVGLARLALWYPFLLPVASAVLVAMWMRHNRPAAAWPLPYDWVVRILGYGAGGFGVLEFVSSARWGYLDEPQYVVGHLVLLAGPVLMLAGARQLSSPRS